MLKVFLLSLPLILTGCIETVVGATVGTAGAVVAQERSTGQAIDDTAIFWRIKNSFLQYNARDLLTGVNVEVIEGRVHLTGYVFTAETRVEAVRLAWLASGVKEVINEITVKSENTLGDMANDKWIKSQVAAKLILEKGVRSINYSVEAVSGVVYLMGIATSQEELDKATLVASKVKGVTRVVSHVRILGQAAETNTSGASSNASPSYAEPQSYSDEPIAIDEPTSVGLPGSNDDVYSRDVNELR